MNERREKNTGFVVFMKDGRKKPYIARITIGYNENMHAIYYDIKSFEKELHALVCLENYHNNPYPLYIKESKYNKINFFPTNPSPLVSVVNLKKDISDKIKKENYTYKQLYLDFKEAKMLTNEEAKIEKKYHIRPENKPFRTLLL